MTASDVSSRERKKKMPLAPTGGLPRGGRDRPKDAFMKKYRSTGLQGNVERPEKDTFYDPSVWKRRSGPFQNTFKKNSAQYSVGLREWTKSPRITDASRGKGVPSRSRVCMKEKARWTVKRVESFNHGSAGTHMDADEVD